MKKFSIICFCSFIVLTTANLFAQQGDAVKRADTAIGGFVGPGFISSSGSGATTEATVRQAALLPNNSQVYLIGNIVHSIGGHRYFFRDNTADAVILVKSDKWAELVITPDDTVEIFGQIKRERKNKQLFYIDVIHLGKK